MSEALHNKAYFLEFCDKSGNSVDAFGFSVPPQAEEMEWGNRKTETQTFGGMHIDDYGADCPRISISGTTGNRTKKQILRRGNTDSMTGEEEFWELQKLLTKYRTGEFLTNGSYIMLTNLMTGEYWRFFPDVLKMSREASMPFVYHYELSGLLTDLDNAVPNSSGDNGRKASRGGKISGGENAWLNKWVQNTESWKKFATNTEGNVFAGVMNTATAFGKKISNTVGNLQQTIQNLLDLAPTYTGLVTGVISTWNDVVDNTVLFTESLAPMVLESVTSAYTDISSAVRNTFDCVKSLCTMCVEMFTEEGGYGQMLAEMFTSATEQEEAAWATTMNGDGDGWTKEALLGLENDSCESCALTQSYTPPEPVVDQTSAGTGVSGEGGESSSGDAATGTASTASAQILLAYGHKDITIKSGDNAEKLAETYFGSADKVQTLLYYNGITDLADLPVGAKLKVPILDKNKASSRNAIYASSEMRDNYGIDIALDDDGGLKVAKTGDFEVMDGTDNLNQAILLRLREGVSKRVRLNAYGIRAVAGDAQGLSNYVSAQIEQTLFQEPRIKSVDGIGLEDAGDYLCVEVKITDINDEKTTVRGLI